MMTSHRTCYSKKTNEEKKLQRFFAMKIAALNSLMFLLIIVIDTYVNGCRDLHPRVILSWWLSGYWVALTILPLFLGNYLFLVLMQNIVHKCVWPYVFTLCFGCVIAFLNFSHPWPNCRQLLGFALFPLSGIIATAFRYSCFDEFIDRKEIPLSARIEWLKETAALWRTVAISGAVAFFAFLMSWLNYMWGTANARFPTQTEVCLLVGGLYSIQSAGITLYVILGPIYESFRKARKATCMLLELRE